MDERVEEPSYDENGNLIECREPESIDPLGVLSFVQKKIVDLSKTRFVEASILPPSEREVEPDGSPSKRAASKNLKSWIGRLTTFDNPDEDEKEAINQVLATFGSVRNFLSELEEVKRTNKKLRFREQRFAHEPLLRRRRVDMLSPSLLRVLVVALQNELAASMEVIRTCALEEHPLLQQAIPSYVDSRQLRDQQDLDLLLESGITGVTPVRTSVADLTTRQRDLIESGLREQNRLLRQQVMRLQSCLTSLPWAEITTGVQGSPRIGSGYNDSGHPTRSGGLSSPSHPSPHGGGRRRGGRGSGSESFGEGMKMGSSGESRNSTVDVDPIETLKERLALCAQQIEKLQQELMRAQSELQRTEATVNAQLDIEAKLIEEKGKVIRTNAQLGTFVMKILQECKPKLAAGIVRKEDFEGWLEKHPGEDYDEEEASHKRQEQPGSSSLALSHPHATSNQKRKTSGPGSTTQTKDVGTLTEVVGTAGGGGGERRINHSTGDSGNENEDYFDDDGTSHHTPRSGRPKRGVSNSSSHRHPIASSASQPGGAMRLPDGRRRRSRPSTADGKRRSGGGDVGRSPNNRRQVRSPAGSLAKNGSATSIGSVASTVRRAASRMAAIEASVSRKKTAGEGDEMYKSKRLPGIVTPLDLNRAVGIDPFSVPANMNDHRPEGELRRNHKTLHPDHPTADMQRPVIFAENVPHSARVLRMPDESGSENGRNQSLRGGGGGTTTARSDTDMNTTVKNNRKKVASSPAEAAGGTLVVPEEVVPFLKPVIIKYDRVLRQIFSHFSQTQAKPVGSQGLFEEIAQWTTSLTHASFYKILAHFYVVPKLMSKKHAFALLIGTHRMIAFPFFIARLLDVAKLIAPRLFVLSDVASVELLQKMYVECAEKDGLLGRAATTLQDTNTTMGIVNGMSEDGGKDGEQVVHNMEEERQRIHAHYLKNLNRIPPISAKNLVAFFMEDNRWKILFRSEQTLRAIIPQNGDGAWSWHDLRAYWWDRCSLSKEAVSSGNRSDLMAAFNLPNILPVRHVSPKKRRKAKEETKSEEDKQVVAERSAIAFDLLVDFMVQTELPSQLDGSRIS